MSVGYPPRQSDLCTVFTIFLANLDDGWVVDQFAHVLTGAVDGILITERTVVCDMDAFALVEFSEGVLLEPGVAFDLVVCGDDGGFFEETLELCLTEVRDTDGLCLTALQSLLHRFPCVHIIRIAGFDLVVFLGNKGIASGEGGGPVHEVEV